MNPTEPDPNNPSGAAPYRVESLARIRGTSKGERWFRSLVQYSSDVVMILEADGTVRYVSPAVERVLGYRPEEMVGTLALDYVHPEDVEYMSRSFAQTLEKPGVQRPIQYRARTADGSWRHMEAIRSNWLDDPHIAGVVANVRDITERKEAEEEKARQARNAQLRADVSTALAEGGTLPSILQRCTKSMVGHLDAAFARIWTLNEEENVLELQASAGRYTRLDGAHSRVPVGEYKIGRIAQERQPHLTNGVVNDPRIHDREWAKREGLVAFAGYPLVVEDRLVGVMAMFAHQPLREDTVEALGSVADSIAQGIKHKWVEESLEESEERYRAVMEQSVETIYLYDAETKRVLESNSAFQKLMGYTEEELLGMEIYHFIDHDRENIDANIQRSLREKRRHIGERRYRRKNGSIIVVDTSASVISYDGRTALCAVSRDVTERKRYEEALKESEERFRALTQNSSDIITLLGTEGTIRYQSPSIEPILGYRPEEMVGDNAFDYVHPDDLGRVEMAFAEGLEDPGRRPSAEYRFRHKDGSWVWLESVGTNLLNDSRVGEFVVNSRDVTERKMAEERLQHQAFHDLLTDLPNRHLLIDRLGQALRRTWRQRERQVAVLFMDLDGFKVVNDSLGHEVGDRLLVAVAERLRGCLRPEYTLARFGGDEFVVMLEDVENPEEAVRVAERITEELRGPFALDDRELYVRASIGIVLGEDRSKEPEDLLRDADTAMYRAKEEAASGYRVFNPAMHERVLGRLELENDLRDALNNEEFKIYYQPKFRLGQTDKVEGLEALVRWEHPQRGLMLPDDFIPVAEETGLIIPIGGWVMKEACRQAKEWQERYPSEAPLSVCVNLSAGQVRHPGLLRDVSSTLRESGLEPGSLVLEITEGTLLKDTEMIETVFRELKGLGLRLTIDDFGKEYSSLSYLKRLPVDGLKIDGSFVGSLGKDPSSTTIVEAVISLAHSLGLEVTGEGVESAEQLEHLRRMECDMAQGFFFSEPLPPEAVPGFLAE